MHKLSTIDSGFLITETRNSPKHVGALQVLRLPPRKGPAWLRRMLADLKLVPPGFPFGHRLKDSSVLQPELIRDERFDIDYHVRHTVLPRPGSDLQLVEAVSRLHANLLDRERPLWEFHLIEGLRDRRFAFYTKIHHALVDGVTFARWCVESGSTTADCPDSQPIWQRYERPRPDSQDDFANRIAGGVRALADGARTAADLSLLAARLLQKGIFSSDGDAVLPLGAGRTRFNVPTGAARAFRITSFPLDEFTVLARSQGASVNDLVMTLCDLAVNRYLAEHGETTAEPLVALMPVDLRAGSTGEGNVISLLQVRLADRHDDPLATLQQVRRASKSTRSIYQSASLSAVQLYTLGVNLLPLGEEMLRLDQLLPPAMNLVISNLPGPREPLYFRGAEVVEIYPVNTLPPAVALSITVCSYAGQLFCGLIAGRTAVPDLSRVTECLREAYADVTLRAAERTVTRRPRS